MTISRRSKSKLLRDYFTLEQTDGGLTIQVCCLKSKPNMVAVATGDTPEIVSRFLNVIRIQAQKTSRTRFGVWLGSGPCVCVALRVDFLLKIENGYLRDAEVTGFTLSNP